MVLAVGFKSDISQQHFIVPTHLFEGSLQVLSWILEIPSKPLFVGAHDAGGSSEQSFTIRVIARPTNESAYGIFCRLARGSLKWFYAA